MLSCTRQGSTVQILTEPSWSSVDMSEAESRQERISGVRILKKRISLRSNLSDEPTFRGFPHQRSIWWRPILERARLNRAVSFTGSPLGNLRLDGAHQQDLVITRYPDPHRHRTISKSHNSSTCS